MTRTLKRSWRTRNPPVSDMKGRKNDSVTPLPKNSTVPRVRMMKPQKMVACIRPGQKSPPMSRACPIT